MGGGSQDVWGGGGKGVGGGFHDENFDDFSDLGGRSAPGFGTGDRGWGLTPQDGGWGATPEDGGWGVTPQRDSVDALRENARC